MAASCDTMLFYRSRIGAGFTAPIRNGRVRLGDKHNVSLGKGFKLVEASCDTAILVKLGNGAGTVTFKKGTLENGRYTDMSDATTYATPTRLAMTMDSFVAVDVPDSTGIWGTAVDGIVTPTGSAGDFASFWDIIAGTADTLYFYDRDTKLAAVSLLSGGGCAFVGVLPSAPRRLKLVAGGR